MDTTSSPKSFKKDVCMIFRTLHTLLNNLECKIMEREECYKQKAQEEAFSRLVNAYLQAVSNSNPDLNSLMVMPRDNFKKLDNFTDAMSNGSVQNWSKMLNIFPFQNFPTDDNQMNCQDTEIAMDNEKEIDLSSCTNSGQCRTHQADEERQKNKPNEEKQEDESNNSNDNKKYKNAIRISEDCTTSQITNVSQSSSSPSKVGKDIPPLCKTSSEISTNVVKNTVSIVVPLDPREYFGNQDQPRELLLATSGDEDLMGKYDSEIEENFVKESKDPESIRNLEPMMMTNAVPELSSKPTNSSSDSAPPVVKALTNSSICDTEPKVKIFGTNFLQEALGSASPKESKRLASSPSRSSPSIRVPANSGRNFKILPKTSSSSDCNAQSSKTVGREGLATDLSHHKPMVNLQDAKIKENQCSLCFQRFTQLNSLKRHLRSHTGERPFPCEYCDKRFVDRERLKVHLRIHTGEKPFSCTLCNRAFSQKSTVKRHMAVHTGLKPFHCSIENCNKKFGTRDNLKVHEKKTHNGPYSSLDSAQFSSSSNSSGSEVIGRNEAKSLRILMDEGSTLTRLNLSVPRTFDPDRGLG
ncbi:uncharacterized protein LOC141852529 [Brevipalpus obovatus]|uniref:uncharacterized protein LOC141852529 n=1 Tax=Brevipalpus obovatus TaxID=246614 RepID=UPI003D9E15CC